jgi:MFS superfamily sulfate permease-like transporter
MKETLKTQAPKDGWAGLKENFIADATAGFVVFLLAMPLSLGIAKASDFPPVMGLVTAIIGGILVSLISGSRLTIKGPAAGLIVVVAGAVAAFGGGEMGWKLALGAMVVAGLVQVLFGLFKFGKLVDIFPLSAIHGMLAAIGIIIIVKQIPVFLDVNPELYKGMSTVTMITSIPTFLVNFDPRATMIGVYSLAIMLGWPYLKDFTLGKIPAPLMVLIVAIPSELAMDFAHTEPPYALLHIGNLVDSLSLNADFSGVFQTGVFIKYVIMFALVGSLESLLTVKAIDLVDPYRRKSNTNQDLIAVGVGNTASALLGGLPMISEVARSSANVNQGAKTRWSNFFHGVFLLGFVLVATPVIEMIPNAALAAMLITVGIKLAHPKEFINTFRIGKEQLAIFLITIAFTLVEDLLVGIAAGVVLKMILHLINGTPISSFFKAPTQVSFNNNQYLIEIDKAAIFSNYLGIKRKLEEIPAGFQVTIDLKNTKLVDHSVMENLHQFEHEYTENGGTVQIIGLENHKPVSAHALAARKVCV